MIGALAYSLVALVRGRGRSSRVWRGLAVRVALAVLLLALLIFGLASGRLVPTAPWNDVHLERSEADNENNL